MSFDDKNLSSPTLMPDQYISTHEVFFLAANTALFLAQKPPDT